MIRFNHSRGFWEYRATLRSAWTPVTPNEARALFDANLCNTPTVVVARSCAA